MNITEISTYFPASGGGLETVVGALSEQFSHHHDLSILYRGINNNLDYADTTGFDVGSGFTGHLRYNWRLFRHSYSADILHAHGQNGLGPALQQKTSDDHKPLIMTFHGTYAGLERVRNRYRRVPIWNPLSLFEKIGARYADRVVACSNQVKDELIDYYRVPREKITVIHNGVDTDLFSSMDGITAKRELGVDPETQYLSWVGNSERTKGLNEAIETVAKLGDIKLLAAGVEGADDENVTYLGRVPKQKMPLVYNASEGFIFPTKYEGHPLVVLEAFATETPVITTESANVEIGEKGVHYIHLSDAEEDDILSFLNHDSSFEFVKDYTWPQVADRYMSLFKSAISGDE